MGSDEPTIGGSRPGSPGPANLLQLTARGQTLALGLKRQIGVKNSVGPKAAAPGPCLFICEAPYRRACPHIAESGSSRPR